MSQYADWIIWACYVFSAISGVAIVYGLYLIQRILREKKAKEKQNEP